VSPIDSLVPPGFAKTSIHSAKLYRKAASGRAWNSRRMRERATLIS
jgi:hypothetical protein